MKSNRIVRLWGSADYEPNLRFFDKMYSVSHTLEKQFEHWRTDRLSVVLSDHKRHELLSLSSKRTGFEAVDPEDVEVTFNNLSGLLRQAIDGLRCQTLKRMGLKLVVYADVDLSFKDILNQIRPYCLPQNDKLESITSSDIVDVAMNFDYKWKDYTVMIRSGPMNLEQGQGGLSNLGDISRLFPSPNESEEISKLFSSIPETFLYFDIDVFTDAESNSKQWPVFANEVATYMLSTFDSFKALILECEK